jgi:hypothetical protein
LGYNLTYKGDYRVLMRVPIDNHFNRVQCAGMITAYSNRIMNRVMCRPQMKGGQGAVGGWQGADS